MKNLTAFGLEKMDLEDKEVAKFTAPDLEFKWGLNRMNNFSEWKATSTNFKPHSARGPFIHANCKYLF